MAPGTTTPQRLAMNRYFSTSFQRRNAAKVSNRAAAIRTTKRRRREEVLLAVGEFEAGFIVSVLGETCENPVG